MSYSFSKNDIKHIILAEGSDYNVYKKRSLILKEDGKEDTSFASDMDDVEDAASDSSSNTFVMDGSTADNNTTTNKPTVDVTATNASDFKNKVNQMTNNPTIKKMGGLSNVNIKGTLNAESKKPKKVVESISFSKKELSDLLKRK